MGFFYDEKARREKETRTRTIPLIPVATESLSCSTCPLDKEEKRLAHPKMKPTGSDDPVIYILGEAPGQNEDEFGKQFVGKAGDTLRKFLSRFYGWKDFEDFRWNNVVRCRPPNNRTPTKLEVSCCSRLQIEDIERTKPVAIFGFGLVPLQWAIPEAEEIGKWHGLRIPVRIGKHECWFFPMFHPSYINRMEYSKELGGAIVKEFERDLQRAFTFLMQDEVPQPNIPKQVRDGIVIQSKWGTEGVLWIGRELEEMLGKKDVSIDIETKGLQPYQKDAKILSVAIGTWEKSIAFCLDHSEAQWNKMERTNVLNTLRDFLFQYKGELWAHNSKFEMAWLYWLFGNDPDILFKPNWNDSIAQVYCLNEQWSKSLEARSIALLGVNVKALSPIGVDKLDTHDLKEVLSYNALDVKYTSRIAGIQRAMLAEEGLLSVYEDQNKRVPALVWMQAKGLVPDFEKVTEIQRNLEKERDALLVSIAKNKDVKEFERATGEIFNPASPAQVGRFFWNHLKREEGWRRVDGKDRYSTDEKVLSQIKHPVAKAILEYRQVSKMLNTYVLPLLPTGKHVYPDGLIHSNVNAYIARTRRTSSDEPNTQNFPKHGGYRYIRNCIGTPKGHLFVSADFGQIEYRVIGMASQDKTICEGLWSGYDIHMDWAKRIGAGRNSYVLERYEKEAQGDKEKVMKLFRQDVKNQWVFPLFFGSQLEPIAKALNMPASDLLPHYKEFWRIFSGVREWQKKMIAFYESHGYVSLLTGWRRHGPLDSNQIINTPIQGTAADIKADALVRLSKRAHDEKRPQLQPILDVHDDLSFYIPASSLEQDIEDIARTMVSCSFSFVNVPITVEISVGTHWGNLEEIMTFSSQDL
jgi:uracil-DNA glycosylase family 4